MTNIRTSALNVLLLGALLTPVLASCGGGSTGTTPPDPLSTGPVVTTPPVTTPPVTTPPATPPTTPVVLPPVVVTIDRPSIQLVERANVPAQTFVLSINRTPDQVEGLYLSNPALADPNAPTVYATGRPEVKNGTTTWYMNVDAQNTVQGNYTYTLKIIDVNNAVVGSTTLKTTVTHDLRLETDIATWSPNERQIFAFVNELRTKGTLNGDARTVAGTCAAGAATAPLKALLPSSVGYLAASNHARWLGTYGYTAHTEPDASFPGFYGETVFDRGIRAKQTVGTNVGFGSLGENAAAGQTSPLEVMKAWLHSVGHCGNIMNVDFTHMAPGYASAPAYVIQSRGNIYQDSWVQVFLKY